MYDGQTKWMCLLTEDDNLLEKYNTIWDRVSAKSLIVNLFTIKKNLKTKRKSYLDEPTDFHHKEILKAGYYYTW